MNTILRKLSSYNVSKHHSVYGLKSVLAFDIGFKYHTKSVSETVISALIS
jgi:hypothetical protein